MEAPTDLVFVHAVGRAGVDAWPAQAAVPGARFLVRRGFADDALPDAFTVDGEAAWLARQVTPGSVLVGHSWSAVATLATAIRVPELRGVAVIEPAATSAAPDHPAVREHVRAMSPAYQDGLSRDDFRRRFSAGMGFELPAPVSARDERALELLRRHRPPWETTMTAGALGDLPGAGRRRDRGLEPVLRDHQGRGRRAHGWRARAARGSRAPPARPVAVHRRAAVLGRATPLGRFGRVRCR